MNIGRGIDTQAEVMQARGVRVVFSQRAGRPRHKPEVSIEVLNMRIARDTEFVLAEGEDIDHHLVVEPL
jgi:hypothetical protein